MDGINPSGKAFHPPQYLIVMFERHILALKGNKVCCVCNELIIYLNSLLFYGLELGADS